MAHEKYGVRLTTEERSNLQQLIRCGRRSARAMTQARILLKMDEWWTAPQAAAALAVSEWTVSEWTVFRTKRRYVEEGLEEVLRHRTQVNRYRKLDERAESRLIALVCSPAHEGHDHWTRRLLADKTVELLAPGTVRLRVEKPHSSRGRSSSGASPW